MTDIKQYRVMKYWKQTNNFLTILLCWPLSIYTCKLGLSDQNYNYSYNSLFAFIWFPMDIIIFNKFHLVLIFNISTYILNDVNINVMLEMNDMYVFITLVAIIDIILCKDQRKNVEIIDNDSYDWYL